MSAASIAAEVEGVGGQPVLRLYATHCIKLVCMAVVPEGSLFKDDAQESLQTVSWRQAG